MLFFCSPFFRPLFHIEDRLHTIKDLDEPANLAGGICECVFISIIGKSQASDKVLVQKSVVCILETFNSEAG